VPPNQSLKLTEPAVDDFAARRWTDLGVSDWNVRATNYMAAAVRRRQLSSGPLGRKKEELLMKQFSIFSVCLLLFLASCKNGSPTSTNDGTIVLFKSSFDSSSSPSSSGWSLSDSSLIAFSTDVPPNGGKYSIVLESSNVSDPRATAKIALPSGNHIYRLSIWAKSITPDGATGLFPPRANFAVIESKILGPVGFANVSDSVWTEYSVTDTLTTQAGDSAEIILMPAQYGNLKENQTYFDLCEFEEIK